MVWVIDLYSAVLVLGSLAAAPLGFLLWNRRRVAGSAAATVALLSSTAWMLGYLGELHSVDIGQAELFARIEAFGLACVPNAWLVFMLHYSGRQHWLTRRNLALLTAVPSLMIVMVITNDVHHLAWTSSVYEQIGPYHRLAMEYGVGFWVFVTLSYLAVGLATFLTLQLMATAHSAYRLQVVANVLAAAIPWAASVHDLVHLGPLPYLDLTPLAFTFTSGILAWNLKRWRMADLIPIARGVILESLEDALVVVDADNRVVDVNNIACELIGSQGHALVGLPLDQAWPELAACLATGEDDKNLAVAQLTTTAGQHFDLRASPLRDLSGRLIGKVLALRDISLRVAAETALRQSENRYALAAQGANDGLWDWDLLSDEVYFSPRSMALLGLPGQEQAYNSEEVFAVVDPADLPRLKADIEAHVAGQTPHLECEFRVRQAAPSSWLLCRGLAVQEAGKLPYRMAGSLTDISARKTAETQLRHAALHDSLTGLGNRSLLMDRLEHALQRARRDKNQSFALLYMDLDRFKLINDSLGHATGDRVLQEIARRIASTFREADTLVRLGGDEFVVLLEGIQNLQGAVRAAERFQEAISAPIQLGNYEIYSSASIGIALANRPNGRAEDMLRDADLALYQAKQLGGARHAFFDQRMHQRALTEFQLETDLRRALDSNSLELYYQPIRALLTRQIVGFEALLRWNHPSRGLLFPKDFINQAEDTGLIVPIGAWALEQACLQLAAWKGAFPEYAHATMGVNLSGRQLAHDRLEDDVRHAVETAGLLPSDLHLEITETLMIEDSILAVHRLSKLQDLGVKVRVDDFGTGYSSLSLLHTFPVDCLKIDRTFVARLEGGGRDAQIVQTIVALAHALQVDVMAEGIETEDQLIRLQALGCTTGQGYLLGRPVPRHEIDELLASTSPSRQLRVFSVD